MTAGTVHIPFKSELLAMFSSPRFRPPPHLVGILATQREDARNYAEVRCEQIPFTHSYGDPDWQFTRKACEHIGIKFELRLVGEARQGMDGEGVGIDVEEAVLDVTFGDRPFVVQLTGIGER